MSEALLPRQLVLIGSGALGSLFAAFLASHTAVHMLSHWPEQILAIEKQGLTCTHIDGTVSHHHFPITNQARKLEPLRTAFLLVKSYQTARAAYELEPVLAPDGLVVTLQNGLGNFELLTSVLGRGRVAQGVTAQGATMLSAGAVRHAGHGPTYLATTPGKEARVTGLVQLLNRAGMPATETEDLDGLLWGKLVVNSGINPLTALLGVTNGGLLRDPRAEKLMGAAAEETAAVAQAIGIALPFADATARTRNVALATANNRSSMLQDLQRGAPTEIDAINGAVVNFGRTVNIATPVNERLWQMVKAREVVRDMPYAALEPSSFLDSIVDEIE
jgi:2-dehydropantoate 2-reductase